MDYLIMSHNAAPTVSGASISNNNRTVDGLTLSANYMGQTGIIIPQYSTARSSGSFSLDYQYRGSRVYLPAPLTVTKLAYNVTTAATTDGTTGNTAAVVDIAVYNSSGNKILSTGAISNTAFVAGTTTGFISGASAFGTTGTKVIGLASPWSLNASTVYFLVMHSGNVVTSPATRASVTMHGNGANALFGTTIGSAEIVAGSNTGSVTSPASVNPADGSSTPIIALRTD